MNTFLQLNDLIKAILVSLILIVAIPEGVAQESLKKEKKAIIAFIKSEYSSWESIDLKQAADPCQLIGHPFSASSNSEQSIENEENQASKQLVVYNTRQLSEPPLRFRDFEFTIVNRQAIVQFCVNENMISAFLEKENGKWKLVCAAPLDKIL